MKIAILTVGDELLIGQVVDTNSAWMARKLNYHGMQVVKGLTVSDALPEIKRGLAEALAVADVVLMTGGLGPTKDDVTKKALAEFFGQGMRFDQPTYDRILKLFERWGRTSTPAHRQQCYMPENATLLFNKMGTAPGMWFHEQGKVVVSMPGVPYEMEYLMEKEVIPKLKQTFPVQPIVHRTILTVGEGESRIAALVEDIEDSLPANIKLAFLPGLGQVRLRLTATGADELTLTALVDAKKKALEDRLRSFVFGYEEDKLERVIGQLLSERGLTLCTAESCTGGYLAHQITSISGASKYFMGSIIAYSNEVKMRQLGVREETLKEHGAVSEQTVIEMVKGALKLLQTDIAVSVSGVAGPTGGTPEKPVGTVWLAVGNADVIQTQVLHIGKDRLKNIQYSAVRAMDMIRRFLLEQEKPATLEQ